MNYQDDKHRIEIKQIKNCAEQLLLLIRSLEQNHEIEKVDKMQMQEYLKCYEEGGNE